MNHWLVKTTLWLLLMTRGLSLAETDLAESCRIPDNLSAGLVAIEFFDNATSVGEILRIQKPRNTGVTASPSAMPGILETILGGSRSIIPIGDVRAIHFAPESRVSIVSESDYTRLLPSSQILDTPETPHWFETDHDDTTWETPSPASPNYRWFYIPGAAWIWRKADNFKSPEETLCVRRSFILPTHVACRRAILYVMADSTLERAWLNGKSLSVMDASLANSYAAMDVTMHVQEGKNLLALRVSRQDQQNLSFAGLAFRLDLHLVPREILKRPATAPQPAATTLENGDILFGDLTNITDRWIELQGPMGHMRIDRDWVRHIRTNYPPTGDRVSGRGIFRKILGLGKNRTLGGTKDYPPYSLRLFPEDPENKTGVLLKSGEFIRGRILEMKNGAIVIKPRYGSDFSLDRGEIHAMYPNIPGGKSFLKYPEGHKEWRCNVETLDGSRVSGIIQDITRDTLSVKPPYTETLKLKSDHLIKCVLPFDSITRLNQEKAARTVALPKRVALIGENNPLGPPYDQSNFHRIQYLLSELGIQGEALTPEEIVNPDRFSPGQYPVCLNLDETESYYKSVKAPGDGYKAMVRFVQNGGRLAHLATGVPAFYGYERRNTRWRRNTSPPYLNTSLKIRVLTPGEREAGVRPFELPENRPVNLYFVLNDQTALSLGLPSRVEFPLLADTRFRPIVEDKTSTNTAFTPIYWLVSEDGINYGAAMAMIEYHGGGFAPNRAFYVSHILFNASYHNHSLLDFLIPRILSITALKPEGQPENP